MRAKGYKRNKDRALLPGLLFFCSLGIFIYFNIYYTKILNSGVTEVPVDIFIIIKNVSIDIFNLKFGDSLVVLELLVGMLTVLFSMIGFIGFKSTTLQILTCFEALIGIVFWIIYSGVGFTGFNSLGFPNTLFICLLVYVFLTIINVIRKM